MSDGHPSRAEILLAAQAIHQGVCPECRGDGPVDFHGYHTTVSAGVFAMWETKQKLCCANCGSKLRWRAIGFCFLLGWWSIYGLIATPVQIARNLLDLARGSSIGPEPSPELEQRASTLLVASQRAEAVAASREDCDPASSTPEARKSLAEECMKVAVHVDTPDPLAKEQLEVAEGWLLTHPPAYDRRLLVKLGESWVKRGDPEAALRAYATVLEVYPETQRNSRVTFLVRQAEQAAGITESMVVPAGILSDGKKFLAMAGMFLIGFAILCVWACDYREKHRTLRIVSRGPLPATVTVPLPEGPQSLEIPPLGDVEFVLPEGEYSIQVELAGEVHTVEAKVRTTWSEFFGTSLFLLNVGGTAVVVWDEAVYSASGNETGRDPEVHFSDFVALHNLDFVDAAFPGHLQLQRNETKTRTRARVLTGPAERLVWEIGWLATPADLQGFLERHLALAPDNQDLHRAYLLISEDDTQRAIAFLESGLARRPAQLAWHRSYQDLVRYERDLQSEYEALLEAAPNDSRLLCLTARVTSDARSAFTLIERALENDDSLAQAWIRKGTLLACRGELDAAASCYEAALERDPDTPDWLYLAPEVALRAQGGDFAALDAALSARLRVDPSDLRAFSLLLQVRARQATDEGFAAALATVRNGFVGYDSSDLLLANTYVDLMALEATGELPPYLKQLLTYSEHANNAPEFALSAFLLDGQIKEAEHVAKEFTSEPGAALLMVIAHSLRDEHEHAERWYREAVERSGPETTLGALLTNTSLTADDVNSLEAPLLDLAALRIALAIRHPDKAEALTAPVRSFCRWESWHARFLLHALDRLPTRTR